MVNENNLINLVENKKAQIEEVRELKDEYKIPSFEEFMKTYEEDEGAVDNYYYEVDSCGDIRVVKCYGPGNGQSNLSDREKKLLVGVTIGVGVGVTVLTAGLAAPVVAKGTEAVINYADSQGKGESSSSNNAHIGSGSVGGGAKGVSKTSSPVWQSLKPYHGEIRRNDLSGSSRCYFTWDYTHCHIEKYNHLGKHLGAIDPVLGNMVKDAVPGRDISKKL